MDITEMRAVHKGLLDELSALIRTAESGGRDLTPDELYRAEEIDIESGRIDLEIRTARVAALAPVAPTTAGDFSMSSESQLRSAALRTVEEAFRSGRLPDYAAERVQGMVDGGSVQERSATAQWTVATGNRAYRAAFEKLVRDPQHGHLTWTAEESTAFRNVAAFDQQFRGLGEGSGAAGGFLVPFDLDPSVLLTNAGSTNPLRKISRGAVIATNAWHGVSSAGSTAGWKAEAAAAPDGTPTFAQPTVPVFLGSAFTPVSFEVFDDASTSDLTAQLQVILSDAADQLMSTAYTTGNGTSQPGGVLTGLSSGQKVAAATADTIVAADVVGLQNALSPRWQARAQWCANLTTINTLGGLQLGSGGSGPLRFPEVENGSLLRRPLNELSTLDAAGHTASAGNDNVVLYGDFSQFLIVDRIGTRIELIQNMLDTTTGRPTGQRGVLMWFRTGAGVLVQDAFRLLTA